MGLGARLPGTKLTLLSHLGAAGGTPNRQCLFLSDSHASIMRVSSAASWSILTSAHMVLALLVLEARFWSVSQAENGNR